LPPKHGWALSLAPCSADNPSLAQIRTKTEQGVGYAQYNLGLMYDNGEGVTRHYAEAAKWIRKAAELGLAEAQYDLGAVYFRGQGVPRDSAYMWFSLAATHGGELDKFPATVAAASLYSIERGMTPDQIVEAQKRAAAWKPKANWPFPEIKPEEKQW
jgi:TPR repeat protein